MLFGVFAVAAVAAQTVVGVPSADRGTTTTSVSGVVFDSLVMRVLPGATVQLVTSNGTAASRTTRSDGSGHFEFADVPVGAYLLGFFHPKLDSLGLTSETRRLDVRTEQPMQTQLSIPSGRTIATTVCGASFVSDGTGLLMGYIRGADNTMPRPSGNVIIRWAEVVIEKGSIKRDVSGSNAFANATGLYAACGIPVGTSILLQASSGEESSGSFEVRLPNTGLLHRDVFVAPVSRVRVRSQDSVPDVELLRGTGRVRGKVLGSNKRAVPGAQVTVWGTGISTTSSESGEFTMTGLPGGTHTLEVRAIGFSPTQIPVDITTGQSGDAQVELAPIAVTLDTVKITAQRAYASRRLLEVERRQRSGMGHIYDAAELTKRNPYVLTDLLRTVPGIRVIPGKWSDVVWMRDRRGLGFCHPEIIVDNVRMMADEDFPINVIVPMNDVRAVEVYTNMVPGEFMSHTECGVIAITTGERPPQAKR